MTDPTQAGQPSEEELRAYLEQLRAAEPAEILVQAYRLLGTGAEVKLGRGDARVLIDAMGGMVDAVSDRVPADLGRQMREGVTQLQMAQVQAERQAGTDGGAAGEGGAAAAGGEAAAPGGGSAREDSGSAPRRDEASRAAASSGQQGQQMTDRLWIPGRGPARP